MMKLRKTYSENESDIQYDYWNYDNNYLRINRRLFILETTYFLNLTLNIYDLDFDSNNEVIIKDDLRKWIEKIHRRFNILSIFINKNKLFFSESKIFDLSFFYQNSILKTIENYSRKSRNLTIWFIYILSFEISKIDEDLWYRIEHQ